MNHRLQVRISEDLEPRLRAAAIRSRMSNREWVRRAIEESIRRLAQEHLESLGARTGDIERMLAEIEAGRI